MAETWVLNEKISRGSASFNFNFKSNGQLFYGIDIQFVISTPPFYVLISYIDSNDDTMVVYNSSNTPAWTDEAYRTITFSTPTTNLIEWLQANATQQLLCGANDMFAVADAIRTKAGSTAALAFPDGFVSAVNGIQTGGGGGVGYKVTFPATATNWDKVNGDYSGLLMADGTVKPITDYSTLAGQTFEGVVGIRCRWSTSYYVLKMTLSSGTIAQTTLDVQMTAQASFTITTSINNTPTYFGTGYHTFWWPLTDVVISSIEMYNTD